MPQEPLGNTFFEYHITVPKETTESAPQKLTVNLTLGVIHLIELVPWGFAVDILHTRIERFHSPVFPVNLGEQVSFVGGLVAGRVYYEIDKRPTTLVIYSWNDSTQYEHSFTVRFWMLPKEIISPEVGLIADLKKFMRLVMGR